MGGQKAVPVSWKTLCVGGEDGGVRGRPQGQEMAEEDSLKTDKIREGVKKKKK